MTIPASDGQYSVNLALRSGGKNTLRLQVVVHTQQPCENEGRRIGKAVTIQGNPYTI